MQQVVDSNLLERYQEGRNISRASYEREKTKINVRTPPAYAMCRHCNDMEVYLDIETCFKK